MKSADVRPLVHFALPFVVGIVAVVVVFFGAGSLNARLCTLAISAVIFSVSMLGLGVVTGSAGMISLCQLTFAGIGAWVVCGLNNLVQTGVLPIPPLGGITVVVWLILGGAAAGLVGAVIALPALRLRGVNLAVVTLAFAAAVYFLLVMIQFPGMEQGLFVPRPTPPFDDPAYLVFCVAVLAACAMGVYFLQGGRWGASWKAIAYSERGTASVGGSVARAKLTAFAVSAVLGGIGGGLLVMETGRTLPSSYLPMGSLALYLLAIISGARFIDMAIVGGILWVGVPALLVEMSISKDWGFVIFGVLAVQALTGKVTLGDIIRNAWWKRVLRARGGSGGTRLGVAATAGATPTAASSVPAAEPVLVTHDLTVEFGNVKALDAVNITVREHAIVGLIGPNGAGKSTFVDAISGFLPGHGGVVSLAGQTLGRTSPTRRARSGLRRTFQQDRVPSTMTIEAYVKFVVRRPVDPDEIEGTLAFFGCPPARTPLVGVDVGTRRLIEVAANALAQPRVLLLDEPAAGLSHDEHIALGERIRQIPERFGAAVVLIEHDLDLVRAVCSELVVLDFGKVIAAGSHKEVLANPEVMKAYMGEVAVA